MQRTEAALDRIQRLDGRLGAFVHLDAEGARACAAALAALRAAGTDLGPLMGLPVAVKDIVAVTGMPTRCGSLLEVGDIVGAEGGFVRRLREAGAVILGKTRTTEFALGAFNLDRPTPLNPWSAAAPLMTGGSSNGSAVAVAAGLVPLAVGSDTGGSVQLPAALTGVAGYKSSYGRWPLDGVFPLAPLLDSLGLFARDVGTIAAAVSALDGEAIPRRDVAGLRLGLPAELADDLDPPVAAAFEQACETLRRRGARLERFSLPELDEGDRIFGAMSALDVLVTLGEERVAAGWAGFDRMVRRRIEDVRGLPPTEGVAARRRLVALAGIAARRISGHDAWIAPTAPVGPVAVADCGTIEAAMRWQGRSSRNTRACNMLALCGLSLPIMPPGGGPPAGLMLMGAHGTDAALIGIAAAVEDALGRAPPAPGYCLEPRHV